MAGVRVNRCGPVPVIRPGHVVASATARRARVRCGFLDVESGLARFPPIVTPGAGALFLEGIAQGESSFVASSRDGLIGTYWRDIVQSDNGGPMDLLAPGTTHLLGLCPKEKRLGSEGPVRTWRSGVGRSRRVLASWEWLWGRDGGSYGADFRCRRPSPRGLDVSGGLAPVVGSVVERRGDNPIRCQSAVPVAAAIPRQCASCRSIAVLESKQLCRCAAGLRSPVPDLLASLPPRLFREGPEFPRTRRLCLGVAQPWWPGYSEILPGPGVASCRRGRRCDHVRFRRCGGVADFSILRRSRVWHYSP